MTQLTILCSGQGAQSPDLFSGFPFTEKGLAIKQSILASGCLSPEVAEWLAAPEVRPSAIFENHFSQPLLCLYQSMIWAEVASFLPRPSLIAGYSLGELSAYGCAGALSPEEVVKLASLRANLMDHAGPQGELLAVQGLPPNAMPAVEGAHVAIIIAEDHFVVGCLAEQASRVAEALSKAGAREVTPLAVSVASHTAILDSAVAPFRTALTSVLWSPPQIPILAGVNAAKVMRREQMEQLLPEQIHRTIRWDLILQRFVESGNRVLLEIGPGRQLAHMAASRGLEARSIEEFRSPEGVASWVENAIRRAG